MTKRDECILMLKLTGLLLFRLREDDHFPRIARIARKALDELKEIPEQFMNHGEDLEGEWMPDARISFLNSIVDLIVKAENSASVLVVAVEDAKDPAGPVVRTGEIIVRTPNDTPNVAMMDSGCFLLKSAAVAFKKMLQEQHVDDAETMGLRSAVVDLETALAVLSQASGMTLQD